MTIFDDMRASGNLPYLFDGRKGSILDVSGSNLGSPGIAGTPTWARTRKGFGVQTPAAGINYLSVGNPASLQLNTATIFAVCSRTENNPTDLVAAVYKPNAYYILFGLGAEPKTFGTWDSGGGAWRVSTFSELPNGKVHLYAISFVSGAVNGTAFYVDGVPCGLATTTVLNQLSSLRLGGGVGAGNVGLGGSILFSGVINKVLRPDQHMQMFLDWNASGFILDLGSARNGVKHFLPCKNDADYVRNGIVLDTDFVRQSDGKVRDLSPSGYAGTVTGIVVPGPDGEGMKFPTTNDGVSWGDVVQINSASKLTLRQWIQLPSSITPFLSFTVKILDGTHLIILWAVGAGTTLRASVYNGGASYADTTAPVLRAGQKQYLAMVFDGSGAADADRLKLYVDGEFIPVTFTGPGIPATIANLVAAPLLSGNAPAGTEPHIALNTRCQTVALTAGQVRSDYLKTGAQQLIWQAPGEDCPVSLAASYGVATPNALGGGWQIIDGTWGNREDSTGRRWLDNTVGWSLKIPQPHAFGTWMFTMAFSGASAWSVQFISSQAAHYATAPNNSYQLNVSAAGLVAIYRYDNGAYGATVLQSAAGYLATGTAYTFAINRRPSDGRFTVYVKGGLYKVWTLLSTAGGFGTNPSAADATHTVSTALVFNASGTGNKLLIHDPTTIGNPGHPRIYQGILDPTRNEV